VQKYERGLNRISAGTLYQLSGVLNIPIGFFFDDAPGKATVRSQRPEGKMPIKAIGRGKKILSARSA